MLISSIFRKCTNKMNKSFIFIFLHFSCFKMNWQCIEVFCYLCAWVTCLHMPWFFQLFFSLKYLFRNILLRCKWLTYFVFFVFLFRQTITQLHFKFDENTRQNLYIRFFRFNFASYLIHFHSFASIISIL